MESISDSLVAVIIPEGAHHLDLRAAHPDDPASVIRARQIEREQIRKWIQEYHNDNQFDNEIRVSGVDTNQNLIIDSSKNSFDFV